MYGLFYEVVWIGKSIFGKGEGNVRVSFRLGVGFFVVRVYLLWLYFGEEGVFVLFWVIL